MNGIDLKLPDHQATLALGSQLGSLIFGGAVVGLTGELGAGKTTLVSGIADGMGLEAGYTVSSPTYTIMQQYPCRAGGLCHLDLYRITGPEDLDSTGYRDFTGDDHVLVVEWPEREPHVLPTEHLAITIRHQEPGRSVHITAQGADYEKLLERLAAER
jgi:tRNA threonylcarbamoyladenosine biosynthesis protein TsaE